MEENKEKFTAASVKNFETEVDYTTFLDNFEGPLDLLLYLIEQEEIEIKDIFVSQVTEQFLSYMKALPYIDLEKASEYLNIAATIINIKARSLLPIPDDGLDEYYDEDDNPEQELIQALEEYKMLKEEAEKLKERETVGYFFKAPDKDLTGVKVQYKDLTLDGLMDAFTKMLMRLERQRRDNPPPREIPKDNFTVVDRAKYIKSTIFTRDVMEFEELFDKNSSTPEIVTTFQALLELLRNQIVIVEQEVIFGTIIIRKNPNISEEQDIGEFDEYH